MKTLIKTIVYFILANMVISCANPVSPSGGPKDTEPPVYLLSDPTNFSVNFEKDRIIIEFDEFVQLKDANNQILISPPVKEKPEYRIRGKSLVVKFSEPLKENTTYTIFFRNSIVDLNEGNPLENFQFVLATGNLIDSMAVRGFVKNAFDRTPSEDVYVMLYAGKNDTISQDSLPYYVYPYYVSRTTSEGFFEVNNVRNQDYKIFALKDINNNFIYDLPNEEIAFLDTMVSPFYYKPAVSDTVVADSIALDSIKQDELIIDDLPAADSTLKDSTDSRFVDLYLYTETDSAQKLLDAKLISNRKLLFAFEYPLTNASIELIKPETEKNNWFIEEVNPDKDTIIYWIKDFIADTLIYRIARDTMVFDTVDFVFDFGKEQEKNQRKRDDEGSEEPVKDYINIKSNARGSFDLNKKIRLVFPLPLSYYRFDGFKLVEGEDTLKPLPYFKDSVKRTIYIQYPWKEETSYELIYPDSVFADISGKYNDSTIYRFRTKSLGDYGIIKLNITASEDCKNMIVQLFFKGENLIKEDYITGSSQMIYEYLYPGEYAVKLICDSNKNNKWDTGDYIEKRQPERVFFFPKTINIRANWEIEEEWIF